MDPRLVSSCKPGNEAVTLLCSGGIYYVVAKLRLQSFAVVSSFFFLFFSSGSLYFDVVQVKAILDEILEKLPEDFNMVELQARAEEKTPYVLVALQECERMNTLTCEIRRTLKELDLGLKVCE